jgi:hypothetical protein
LVNEITKTVEVRVNTGKKFSEGLICKDNDYIISKALPNIKIKVSQFFND